MGLVRRLRCWLRHDWVENYAIKTSDRFIVVHPPDAAGAVTGIVERQCQRCGTLEHGMTVSRNGGSEAFLPDDEYPAPPQALDDISVGEGLTTARLRVHRAGENEFYLLYGRYL